MNDYSMYGNTNTTKGTHLPLFLLLASIAELVIIIILVIVLASNITVNSKTDNYVEEDDGDYSGTGDENDAKALDNDTISAPIAVWSSATYGMALPRSSCSSLAHLSESYVQKYGNFVIMNSNICNEATVQVAAETDTSEYYPFTTVYRIYVGNNRGCAKFDFYSNFEILQSYHYEDKACSVTTSSVNLY